MNLNEAQIRLNADITQLYQTYQLISSNKKQFNELDVALLQQQLLQIYHALLVVQGNLAAVNHTALVVEEVLPMAGLKTEPLPEVEQQPEVTVVIETEPQATFVETVKEELPVEIVENTGIDELPELVAPAPTNGLLFDLNTSVSSLNLITENEPTLDDLEALAEKEEGLKTEEKHTEPILPLFATPVAPPEKPILANTTLEPASLHDKLTANVKVADVYQKINKEQTQSLKQAINLNKKIAFVNHLFNENTVEYAKAIEKLNASASLHEALRYFSELKYQYNWSTEHTLVKDLEQLIEKRFA